MPRRKLPTPDHRGIVIGRRVVSLGEITCSSVSLASLDEHFYENFLMFRSSSRSCVEVLGGFVPRRWRCNGGGGWGVRELVSLRSGTRHPRSLLGTKKVELSIRRDEGIHPPNPPSAHRQSSATNQRASEPIKADPNTSARSLTIGVNPSKSTGLSVNGRTPRNWLRCYSPSSKFPEGDDMARCLCRVPL